MSKTVRTDGVCVLSRYITAMTVTTASTIEPLPRNGPGMSEIRLGGITSPRWTYTRLLSARPIRDIYGIIETPDTAGLVDASDAAGKELRSEGATRTSQIAMSPRASRQGIKVSERNSNK